MKILLFGSNLIFILLLSYNTKAITSDLDKLDHQNLGCPINSSCSKKMGQRIQKWENFLANTTLENQFSKLKDFFSKDGIPINFLTKEESKISLDPVLWDSRCKIHKPKNPNDNVLKGMKFLKKLPESEFYNFTPIILYDKKSQTKFKSAYEDYPVAVDGKKLLFIKDYDDFYFHYSVNERGEIQIENPKQNILNIAMSKRIGSVKCPKDKPLDFDKSYFGESFCQKIFNIKTLELQVIQYAWSCP